MKDELGITKNYSGITLTLLAAKVIMSHRKTRKFLEKIRMAFEEIAPQPH